MEKPCVAVRDRRNRSGCRGRGYLEGHPEKVVGSSKKFHRECCRPRRARALRGSRRSGIVPGSPSRRTRRRSTSKLSILCVAVLGLLAQGPTEELSARDALARFDALPVLRQAMLVRRLEQKVALADDPAVRRIASLRLDPGVPLPDAPAPVWFDPAEWAPVAPERRVAPPSDPRHRAVRAAMPEVTVMPDLARGVRYDWRTGSIIRARSLGWRERFANLAHGYPPGADEAYARVLAALDRDPLQRRLADYFE